jgi:hypothetical protein
MLLLLDILYTDVLYELCVHCVCSKAPGDAGEMLADAPDPVAETRAKRGPRRKNHKKKSKG